MVKSLIKQVQQLAVFALLLLLAEEGMAAIFQATVDRTMIAPYETLELTLRTDENTDKTPDLAPLDTDFDVIATRQNRQVRIINGQTESWQDWIVTLSPRGEGTLTIPPIKLGSLQSNPVTVRVEKKLSDSDNNARPVFMHTEVDHDYAYVQQQVVLTLKVFYRVSLYDDSRLSPLAIDNAIVQQLGENRKYDTVVGGKRYEVFELKFAIYPQKTGLMEIPAMTFNGTMAGRNDPFGGLGGMFSMTSGKPVVARSPAIMLNVQPQPASYKGRNWLPARNLSLMESWSKDLDEIHVGDAITRTITITADGLASAQLPGISAPKLQSANVYPDQSKTEDTPTEDGVIGQRLDAIAIIPTQPGQLTLPAVRYSWFDTVDNEERVAELPTRTINILPSDSQLPITPSVPAAAPANPTNAESEAKCPPAEPVALPVSGDPWTLWHMLTGLFALLWLITLALWFRRRRIPTVTDSITQQTDVIDESNAFKILTEACQQKNANEVKLALVDWCQCRFQDRSLKTIGQCLDSLGSETLRRHIRQIDIALYSSQKTNVPFAEILRECRVLKKTTQPATGKRETSLPALYPRRK